MEVLDGQQLGDVGALRGIFERGDLRQLAVLQRQLRRRRDLDLRRVAERALRERREPAQRLDLVAEQVDADRAVLRRRVEVEQAAADRELPAVLHLLDALVAGGDEVGGRLLQVEQLADAQDEAVRAQGGIRDLLRQRDGADDDDGRCMVLAFSQQRVERRDAQADEMRRRREMRLVRDAPRRVEAHRPRREPSAQVGREIARVAVVAGDDEQRLARVLLRERRDDIRPQRQRHERTATIACKHGHGRIVGGVGEQRGEHQVGLGAREATALYARPLGCCAVYVAVFSPT